MDIHRLGRLLQSLTGRPGKPSGRVLFRRFSSFILHGGAGLL